MNNSLLADRVEQCRRAGITLLEVLVSIFVTGIGLLALLALFPLGLLDIAQAIKDDRAGEAAISAVALSEAGEELLARTEEFIAESLANRSVDPKSVIALRMGFEALAGQAADVEDQLVDLEPLIQKPKLKRKYAKSLAEIDAIQYGIGKMIDLFRLFEGPNPPQ